MRAKMFGDVPEKYKQLAQDLENQEDWFTENGKNIPALAAAKGFTCMAHDWYVMGMDDEGERLLNKADTLCPGYFQGPVLVQMAKDDEYDYLVRNLRKLITSGILAALGYKV